MVVKELAHNLTAVTCYFVGRRTPPCNRFVWLINLSRAASSGRGAGGLRPTSTLDRTPGVRIFALASLGSRPVKTGNPRRNDDHRREQRDAATIHIPLWITDERLPPKLPLWVEFPGLSAQGQFLTPRGRDNTRTRTACGVLAFSAHDQHLLL